MEIDTKKIRKSIKKNRRVVIPVTAIAVVAVVLTAVWIASPESISGVLETMGFGKTVIYDMPIREVSQEKFPNIIGQETASAVSMNYCKERMCEYLTMNSSRLLPEDEIFNNFAKIGTDNANTCSKFIQLMSNRECDYFTISDDSTGSTDGYLITDNVGLVSMSALSMLKCCDNPETDKKLTSLSLACEYLDDANIEDENKYIHCYDSDGISASYNITEYCKVQFEKIDKTETLLLEQYADARPAYLSGYSTFESATEQGAEQIKLTERVDDAYFCQGDECYQIIEQLKGAVKIQKIIGDFFEQQASQRDSDWGELDFSSDPTNDEGEFEPELSYITLGGLLIFIFILAGAALIAYLVLGGESDTFVLSPEEIQNVMEEKDDDDKYLVGYIDSDLCEEIYNSCESKRLSAYTEVDILGECRCFFIKKSEGQTGTLYCPTGCDAPNAETPCTNENKYTECNVWNVNDDEGNWAFNECFPRVCKCDLVTGDELLPVSTWGEFHFEDVEYTYLGRCDASSPDETDNIHWEWRSDLCKCWWN